MAQRSAHPSHPSRPVGLTQSKAHQRQQWVGHIVTVEKEMPTTKFTNVDSSYAFTGPLPPILCSCPVTTWIVS